ncbi:MAG TPA: acyl-ACP desaturase [Chloroflexia bacterium]|jgi:acyl-[acyl-carrier-protein] desaturase
MRLTAADQRLENKLRELYTLHLERSNKIDWSYHDLIPWERGRNFKTDPWHPSQATISPELALAVETALLTEVNLPWFTTGLTQIFEGSLEVLQDFVRTWTSEEDQHSNILETYLLVTRNDDPDRLHKLRKQVLRNAWTPGEASPFEGMAYTTIQELSTQAFYVSVARRADSEDPVLANILRTVAKDETLHYTFYREALKAHLQIDPNYIWPLCDVLMNFAMPGYLMPNFHERQRVISAGANYGIAEYYRQVIDVVVRLLDIKNLHPTYPQAQAALNKLNKYLDSLARLAARMDKQRHASGNGSGNGNADSGQATRDEAKRLLGYELWGYEWENPETGATWSNRG